MMGSVGVLTQGRLPPEPRFTLPPCSRTGPRGRERGSTLRGGGSPDSGAATSDQAGKGTAGTQHLLGASCAHLPNPALAQILCEPPSSLWMEEGPWGQPQAQK